MSESSPVIFWFRRDLRVTDHPALAAAAERGPVVPVFIFDDTLTAPAGDNRMAFLIDSLADLDANSLGGALVVRSGGPAEVLAAVADETGATAVYATDDHGPYGRRRDDRVGEALADRGMEVHYLDSNYAIAPDTVKTGSGTSYKVFTPFFRAWSDVGWAEPGGKVDVDWVTGVDSDGLPDAPEVEAELPPVGEQAAWDRFRWFLDDAIADYDEARDRPAIDGTSRLSPYLKWGVVHPRQLLAELDGRRAGHQTYRKELAWREFYADVLFARPETAHHAFNEKMTAMEVDTDAGAKERFETWCRGETGYPIVDAGMRQLLAEGWMHNRVRMIVASFLVKDLHVDWTWGARHFMRHLVDGDLASNQHGWQWVAGTGTDASPYFRIFNPTGQAQKFDPSGDYVRRYVPELAGLDAKRIHEPWDAGLDRPADYPAPMVDHGAERAESLERYDRLKTTWE
ncbi:MAG: deoxyribodipyrimidine photo-lyase [Acidimicrobiales bacterium]